MEIEYFSGSPKGIQADALLVEFYKGFQLPKIFKTDFKDIALDIEKYFVSFDKEPEKFDTFCFPLSGKNFKFVLLSYLGDSFTSDDIRIAASKLINEAKKLKLDDVAILPLGYEFLGVKAVSFTVEGALLGNYSFSKYKSANDTINRLIFVGPPDGVGLYEKAFIASEAANYVRDLVNEPANVMTPSSMADEAVRLAKELGLEIKVFDEKDIAAYKMAGILAVGSGSNNLPRFVHIAYKPFGSLKKVAIIGKGVTFDSGGLNIKPEQFMKGMKADKAGACAVLGILKGVSQMRLPVEVHGLIPLVENMPDGSSYRPDDIIVFKNGKSVEIKSTDAEGRLILADALIYTREFRPDIIIDIATLTGACVVALGRYTSGLFTKDDELAQRLLEASNYTGEKLWRLPLDDDLFKDIKGDFSHLKNVGKTRYGGAITAALFLKEFVPQGVLWAHIDIAGPSYLEENWKYYEKGATGQPVRTILEFLSHIVS